MATGKVTDICFERHRHTEFLKFLKQVAKEYPRHELPCTSRRRSWLNIVEILFGIITPQAIRSRSFDSIRELTAAIRRFIDGSNDRCQPFTWTKPADEIFAHASVKKLHERETRQVTN